jgi:hypothetical protein
LWSGVWQYNCKALVLIFKKEEALKNWWHSSVMMTSFIDQDVSKKTFMVLLVMFAEEWSEPIG